MAQSPAPDAALAEQLRRIEGYMRGCALLPFPRAPSPLRDELAAVLRDAAPRAVSAWIAHVAEAFTIPDHLRETLAADIDEAIQRWIRHIADPTDVETYQVLREHARRGFVSRFPASRFLAGQTKVYALMCDAIRERYPKGHPRRADLLSLLTQEYQERAYHITDFFVAAREDLLREQEATYRRSIDAAPAMILQVGYHDGAVLAANFVAERKLGWAADDLRARKTWELHPPAERAAARQLFEETKAKGNASRDDMHHLTRAGASIPLFINAGVIEYGEHRFIQQICVDISDRKRLEAQLIQSEKMAAIGQLAAGIAHEIRNPLAIIMNALYDLAEIVDRDDPEVREDLRIAKEEMDRVQAIIASLLEFSRDSTADLEPVDVNDLIRKTLQLMDKYLKNHDVRVEAELADLEPCTANENALRQIFLNLITNAVQAMPHGGTLRVRSTRDANDHIVLEFADTGIGIPQDQIKDIFNPFFTTKSSGQGTGLGLSVVHSVVRRYQGDIHVESTPSVGTTFTIELPCGCDGAESLAP